MTNKLSRRGYVLVLSLLLFTTCDTGVREGLQDSAGLSPIRLPAVASAKALSRHYVEVTFAGPADVAAKRMDLFTITAQDSTPLSIHDVFVGDDATRLVLTTDPQEEIQYALRVEGVPPSATTAPGTPVANNAGVITFQGSNTIEPILLSAVAISNTNVLLIFSQRMDRTSTQNRAFYSIADPDLNVTTASLALDDISLMLTTSPQQELLYKLVVTNVRGHQSGTNGFFINPNYDTAMFQGIGPVDTTRPRLVGAAMSDYQTVVLTFSEPLENNARDVANYVVAPSLTVLGVTLNEWGTQATVQILPVTAGVNYQMTVNNVEDRSGNVIDPAFKTAMFGIAADEAVRPTLVSAVAIDCQTVLATFSEPMMDNAGDPSNYSIDPPATIVSAQLSDFKTQVLFTTQPLDAGTDYTITAANLEDSVGNAIDPAADSAMFSCEVGGNVDSLGPLPRVVGAASLSNTTVLVGFDRPMGDSAEDPTHYFIVQTNVNGEVGTLFILDAEFPEPNDRTLVRLTTTSQNEVTYQVTAVAVTDEQGNPLAPKIGFNGLILQDPTSAVFPGTPPTCAPRSCSNGSDGNDGDGGCASDDDCDDNPPCNAAEADCEGACVDPCELADSDEDGIPDSEELRGRVIKVALLGGEFQEREVTSNPFVADTDRDGLGDLTERTLNTNPRLADTDGDALSDEREFNFFYSNPASQDSDNDGTDDGLEVTFFKTAPHLADTDGDGFDDGKELYELSRNPNQADLPEFTIQADNIRLLINEKYSFTDTDGRTVSENSSSQATLTQSQETKSATSDTDVLKVGVELALEISKDPSFTIGGNFGAEWTTQTTNESAQMAQQQYQNSLSRSFEVSATRQVQREIVGASVNATVTILNQGDIAFTVGNIEVSALQQSGLDRSKFVPVATLVPSGGNNTFNLGPFIPERGPFVFNNTDVFPSLVEDLLRNPRGLILKVANFDLTDEFGRNYAFTSQEVNDRTAEIRIDPGDGRVLSFRVATYGGLDDAGFAGMPGEFVGGFNAVGQTAGIPLDYAMQAILKFVKNPTNPDSIVAGANGFANTVAAGDDVQVVPPGTIGVDDRQVVVTAGENGVLNTVPTGDDQLANTLGYDTSATCNEFTQERIIEPLALGNGFANTARNPLSDDVQVKIVGAAVLPGDVIVSAGPNGVLETVANFDEERHGPGNPCETNAECPGGACDAREVMTRFENSKTGDRRRFWVALTSDQIPVGTDFGQITLRPGFVLLLAFIQDIDRDGLSAQEEYLNRSNDRERDSDFDRIGDFVEIRQGWSVEVAGMSSYAAFPNPALKDSDADGVRDDVEQRCETDPSRRDTDNDNLSDAEELNCGICCRAAGSPLCLSGGGTEGVCCKTAAGTSCDFEETCDANNDCTVDGDAFTVCVTALRRQYCSTNADCAAIGVCCTSAAGTSCDFSELCDVSGDCAGDGDANTVCVVNLFPTCTESCNGVCPPLAAPPFPPTRLDPRNADTDRDLVIDSRELVVGSDPLDPTDAAAFRDVDEDGLTDAMELAGWNVTITLCSNSLPTAFNNVCNDTNNPADPAYGRDCADCGPRVLAPMLVVSSPADPDTDFDGLPDLVERSIGTHPDEVDTDRDGLSDFDEFNRFGEFLRFNFEFGGFFLAEGDSQKLGTDPRSQDTDGDELSDDFELLTGWRVVVAEEGLVRDVHSSPLFPDSDLDNASDQKELRGGDTDPLGDGNSTDPMDPDTDGDTRFDGEEFGRSNPLMPDIFVTVRVWQLRDIDGPDDNGQDEWSFDIQLLRPNQGLSTTLLTQASLVGLVPALGTLSSQCRTNDVWTEISGSIRWTLISRAELAAGASLSFGLPLGDALVLEGSWGEFDSCTATNPPTYLQSCSMAFQEVINGSQLIPGAYIPRTITLSTMAPEEICSAIIDVEIIVE